MADVELTYHGPDQEVVDLGQVVTDGDKITVDAALAGRLLANHGFTGPDGPPAEKRLKPKAELVKQAEALGLQVEEHQTAANLATRIKAAGGDPHPQGKAAEKGKGDS